MNEKSKRFKEHVGGWVIDSTTGSPVLQLHLQAMNMTQASLAMACCLHTLNSMSVLWDDQQVHVNAH